MERVAITVGEYTAMSPVYDITDEFREYSKKTGDEEVILNDFDTPIEAVHNLHNEGVFPDKREPVPAFHHILAIYYPWCMSAYRHHEDVSVRISGDDVRIETETVKKSYMMYGHEDYYVEMYRFERVYLYLLEDNNSERYGIPVSAAVIGIL